MDAWLSTQRRSLHQSGHEVNAVFWGTIYQDETLGLDMASIPAMSSEW